MSLTVVLNLGLKSMRAAVFDTTEIRIVRAGSVNCSPTASVRAVGVASGGTRVIIGSRLLLWLLPSTALVISTPAEEAASTPGSEPSKAKSDSAPAPASGFWRTSTK